MSLIGVAAGNPMNMSSEGDGRMSSIETGPVHAIILAGGKSSRMGADKKELRINGESLLARLHRFLTPHFDGIIISTSSLPQHKISGARYVIDEEPGKGPLMAIYSSLKQSSSRVNFVIACDIPEVDLALVRRMLSFANACDIIVPSFAEGMTEPLFAVYCRPVIPIMARQLADNRLRPADCYPLCTTKIIPVTDNRWYINLNTPDTFTAYRNRRQEPIA